MYTIKLRDGGRDVRIEQSLSAIEGMFTTLRDGAIAQREALTDDDRAVLCVFTAAMYFRSRKSRDHHRGQFQRVLDLADRLRHHMQQKRAQLPAHEYAKYSRRVAAPRLSANEDNSLSVADLEKLRDEPLQALMWPLIQAYSSQMYEMNLTFLEGADDLGFITSDAPTVVRKPGERGVPSHLRAPGLADPWTEVMMPVTPDVLAAFSWQSARFWTKVTRDQQDDLNQLIRWYSDREIVVRRNETRPHWFSHAPKVLG